MPNEYYDSTGAPAQSSHGSSLVMRAEFDAIEAGFAKLPPLAGNAGKAVVVNGAGNALTVTAATLSLAVGLTTTGAGAIALTSTGATNVTLPTTGTLATLAGTETLTNKTLTSPTINGATFSGTLDGTVTFSGSVTSNTFASSGATLTGGSIDNMVIGGVTPAAGAFTTLSASSNATIGGTLGVTGNTTIGGTLGVTGAATFSDDVTAGGTGYFGTSLNVGGSTAVRRIQYGYTGAPYYAITIGAPADNNASVALAVDVSSIAGGQFTGQGQTIIGPNGILVPNAAGTDFLGVVYRDASNGLYVGPDYNGGRSSGPLYLAHTADAINRVSIGGGSAGNAVYLAASGSDTDVSLRLATQGSGSIVFELPGGTARWSIDGNGHILAGSDNAYDIGADGVNRPRTIYAATSMRVDTNTAVGGSLILANNFNGGSSAYGVVRAQAGGNQYVDIITYGGGGQYCFATGGTGFNIGTSDAAGVYFNTNNSIRWYIHPTNGAFLAGADNTYDIGESGDHRPRTGYFGTGVLTPSLNIGSGADFNYLFRLSSVSPRLFINETDVGADLKNWDLGSFGTIFALRAVDDADATVGGQLQVVRSAGTTLDSYRFLTSATAEQFRVTHTASAVNYLQATGGATGNPPSLTAQGSDPDIDVLLAGKGTGQVLGTLDIIPIAASDETTPINAGAGKITYHLPYDFEVISVMASLTEPASSGTFTVDININGSSILSTKLTIDEGEETSLTAATPAVLSSTSLEKGDKLMIDVDDDASGDAAGLKVTLIGRITGY